MSQVIAKYPVAPKADRDAEKAERQVIRAMRAGLQEVVDASQTDIDALAGAPIGVVRAAAQAQRRMIGDLARAVRRLALVVGGADR